MKRRILIIAFAALFCVGIVMALNREPIVSAGAASVITGTTETTINGTEIATLHNGKLEEKSQDFDIKKIAGECRTFELTVQKNPGTETITRTTDMSVGFSGRYCDGISYAIYDLEGKPISAEESSLELPTKDIEGCVVKVNVKWGREKNYRQFVYFFRVNYIKTE